MKTILDVDYIKLEAENIQDKMYLLHYITRSSQLIGLEETDYMEWECDNLWEYLENINTEDANFADVEGGIENGGLEYLKIYTHNLNKL